ncbi:MAG: NAD-dependent epimerase/dehydratase family protein [Rhodothermales bacterium]
MADIKGSRVLVIGGAGFIGSHIVDRLLREDVGEVVVFDNFCRGSRENLAQALTDDRVRIFEAGGDITRPDILRAAAEGCDYAFHLAALWLLQCHEYPRAAFTVNVEGTFNVLEACRDAGIKKLVYSSSASVYGDALETPMTEDHPYNNRTFYGATKIAGEHMCRAFNERYGLDYVGLRYMNVYGPRQDYKGAYVSVIMKILDRIDAGLPPIVYGDGSQAYDFIYVEEVARANLLALQSDATDECFNVGCGRSTSIKALCELLLELTGSTLPIQYEPAGQTFVTRRVGSTEKAERLLDFNSEVELADGLQRLIRWRRADIALAA